MFGLSSNSLPICRVRFRPQPAENEDGARAEYFGPPHPGAAGRPLTRELSYSLSAQIPAQSPAKSKAQSTVHSTAPFSAQRSGKTVAGFRTRRTNTAQSSPQFSAPSQPHCGSAFAPPRLPSPAMTRTRRPSRPHVPWTGNADAFPLPASTSVLCPRAGGNLIQTQIMRLNDFLLQRARLG